ncbi:Ff.00g082030.m01.CDS01 [Fusarium sp. VM40]|nr:Ff.00g082030.m01.CDS01 [Fusarium sp. VM40]
MADQVKHQLPTSTIHRIQEQMASEIFKLAGRDPKQHAACFTACVKLIENTKVVYATNMNSWLNDNPITIGKVLDDFKSTDRTGRTSNLCMIPATTAVVIAAALNQQHICVDGKMNQHVTKEVSQIWAYLGIAIDVWPEVEDSQFFVKTDLGSLEYPVVRKISRGKFVVKTPETGEELTPLMLLATARLNGWVTPSPDASWLKKAKVDSEQIIHRRKALNDGKRVIDKLGNRKYKQNDKNFMREMKAWLSEPVIRNDKDWLPIIDAAEEDLSVWRFAGKAEATVATFFSDDIDWQKLALNVRDQDSTRAINKLVQLAEQAQEIQRSQKDYLPHAVPSLMEIRKTLIEDKADSPPSQAVFSSALNQCFLSQEANGRKNILVGALQRLFDNIVDVVSINHPLCSAFFDLASNVDEVVISCIDLNVDRAKKRHQHRLKLNDELNCRNEVVTSVAETITNLETDPTTPGAVLRSRICSILDSADALTIQESLSHRVKIVVRSRGSDENAQE